MYRIRFHGRGGQGMKTASRILGSALFIAGFEVQDAPRYGAERRGAPIFAYVRAAKEAINERGIITNPDLIIVADETLIPMPSVHLTAGATADTIMLIRTAENADIWQKRLNFRGRILAFAPSIEITNPEHQHYIGIACASGAAALIKQLSWNHLEEAINAELAEHPQRVIDQNIRYARIAFTSQSEGPKIAEGTPVGINDTSPPLWINLEFAPAQISAPAIHAAKTSVEVKTGLWRTHRPLIDRQICHHCWWICSTYCPDGAIQVAADGSPQIDYDHCKGCMVCLSQCPHHAISATPENEFNNAQEKGTQS